MKFSYPLLTANVLCAVLLASCASNYEHVPPGYTEPTALIRDGAVTYPNSQAHVFAVVEIDGNPVPSIFKTYTTNGTQVNIHVTQRDVKAVPIRLKLRADSVRALPIMKIIDTTVGTSKSVEGVINFTPKANHFYVVRGEISSEKAMIWLEDGRSGERVSEILAR